MTEEEQQSESETELIRRIVGGAKDEYRHLVIRYQDRIFSLIKRQVGDDSISRELTQDVFVRAYQHLSKYRHEAKFSTWLIRIALNVASSHFSSRRFKEQLRTVSLLPEHSGNLAAADNSDDEHALAQVQRIVGTLPEKHRVVMVLCSFERKNYEEVAEFLGIPVGTVRSRLNTARQMVREKYFGGL